MKDMLEVQDIATLVNVSPSTARRLIDRLFGEGAFTTPRITDSARRRVRRDEFQRYADRRGIVLDWSAIER